MRHAEARRLLAARRYLSPEERHRLDEHLGGCDGCRAVEEDFERQDAYLAALPLGSPPPGLRSAVLSGAPGPARTSRWNVRGLLSRAHLLPASTLTVVAIAFVVAAVILHAHTGRTHVGAGPVTGPGNYRSARTVAVSRQTPSGLKITLMGPVTSADSALTKVTVTVTNTSNETVPIEQAGAAIGAQILRDETAGTPVAGGSFGPLGPGPGQAARPPLQLQPGASIERDLYGVAMGRYLRAFVEVQNRRGYAETVEGPTLTLLLTSQHAPDVVLHTGSQVQMTVNSILPKVGPLFYSETTSCMEDSGSEHEMGAINGPGWSTSSSPVLTARWPTMPNFNGTCTHDFEWHVIAGYLGQPIVHLDYVAPAVSVRAGEQVPIRSTTCGADRGNLPEVPAAARNAAGETQVVRAACASLADTTPVELASMSATEWRSLAGWSTDSGGDQWVWVVVVHGAPVVHGVGTKREQPFQPSVASFAFDGLTGRELRGCRCNWLGTPMTNGMAPAAPCPTPTDGLAFRGVVAPGSRRPHVRFLNGFVPNRIWEGNVKGSLIVIASGRVGDYTYRGIIEVRAEARCTGLVIPGASGDYYTPKGVGIPTMTHVFSQNDVSFTSKAGYGDFYLNTRKYSAISPPAPHAAQSLLEQFGRAIVAGDMARVRAFLPPNFTSDCGPPLENVRRPTSISAVLCAAPSPITAFHLGTSASLDDRNASAFVRFHMRNGRDWVMSFHLQRSSNGWHITGIVSPS